MPPKAASPDAAKAEAVAKWQASCPPYTEVIKSDKGMAHLLEWVRCDTPLATKDGGDVQRWNQAMSDQIFRQSPTQSTITKPPKDGPVLPQLPMPDTPPKENVLVFTDSYGYCDAIMNNAPEGRIGLKKVVKGPWHQYEFEDIGQILKEFPPTTIVFGATCDIPRSNDPADIIEFQTHVIQVAFYLVKTMASEELDKITKVCFVTRGVFEEGSELYDQVGLSLTSFACMYGFSNTVRTELGPLLNKLCVQYIDTEYFLKPPFWSNEDYKLPERLASEVWNNESFGRDTVRLLNKGRFVCRQQLAAVGYAEAGRVFQAPKEGEICAISGGNGSLGIIMADWIIKQAKIQGKSGFKIQLVSRSGKITDMNTPPFEKMMENGKAQGITVEHYLLDICNQAAADKFVEQTEGKLVGFIHSAGVLNDQMIVNKTWAMFEKVWTPKHRAAYQLNNALERLPNKIQNNPDGFFWMFSSAAIYGSPGQLNYASSNSFLDGIARYRRANGHPGQTFQWGGWGEVGMAANMDEANRRRMNMGPQPSFTNKQGIAGMEWGLKTNVPNISVYQMNMDVYYQFTAPDDGAGQGYFRNFTSHYIPPMPLEPLAKHAYSLHRNLNEFMNPNAERLTWKNFVAPYVEKEEPEEYDEATVGAGLAGLQTPVGVTTASLA